MASAGQGPQTACLPCPSWKAQPRGRPEAGGPALHLLSGRTVGGLLRPSSEGTLYKTIPLRRNVAALGTLQRTPQRGRGALPPFLTPPFGACGAWDELNLTPARTWQPERRPRPQGKLKGFVTVLGLFLGHRMVKTQRVACDVTVPPRGPRQVSAERGPRLERAVVSRVLGWWPRPGGSFGNGTSLGRCVPEGFSG